MLLLLQVLGFVMMSSTTAVHTVAEDGTFSGYKKDFQDKIDSCCNVLRAKTDTDSMSFEGDSGVCGTDAYDRRLTE